MRSLDSHQTIEEKTDFDEKFNVISLTEINIPSDLAQYQIKKFNKGILQYLGNYKSQIGFSKYNSLFLFEGADEI